MIVLDSMKNRLLFRLILMSTVCLLAVHSVAFAEDSAQNIAGPAEMGGESEYDPAVRRGEAVSMIMESFDVRRKNSNFVNLCLLHVHDCFFTFAAQSDFDEIMFAPLRLYPDVNEKVRYYDSINLASMMGLVHGYISEDSTPFKPEVVITRIQALKIIFGAAEALKWKEKFELAEEDLLPVSFVYENTFTDVQNEDSMWWYHRYLRFALESSILEPSANFRPDEPVTMSELNAMIDSVKLYIEQTKE